MQEIIDEDSSVAKLQRGFTMDTPTALEVLGLPSCEKIDKIPLEDINRAFINRLKELQNEKKTTRRNVRRKQSDKIKVRRLNEALQFLTNRKMRTWHDGGRKGKVFCMAVQAFQLDPTTRRVKAMMRQREIDKKKKREADGAKAQELAEDILEDAEEDHQSVIDKDHLKKKKKKRKRRKHKKLKDRTAPRVRRYKSPRPSGRHRSRSRSTSGSRSSTSNSRSSSSDSSSSITSSSSESEDERLVRYQPILIKKQRKDIFYNHQQKCLKPRKVDFNGDNTLHLPKSMAPKFRFSKKKGRNRSHNNLTASHLDLRIHNPDSGSSSSTEDDSDNDIASDEEFLDRKKRQLSLKLSKLKFDSLDDDFF